jgi:transcriptional regulator with GAF, ATPase, and Fis domain
MSARLIGIAGSPKGTILELGVVEISIGREKSNVLCIDEPSVSRQHCVIRAAEERFRLFDLDSRNGTYVNGLPVKERVLENGDQIRVGHCCLLFLAQEENFSSPIQLDEGPLENHETVLLRPEDVRRPASGSGPQSDSGAIRLARDLRALLNISEAITSTRGLEPLSQQLLESIFEVVPAERAAILLVEKGQEEFAAVYARDRGAPAAGPVPVSQTIVQRVLRERVAILSNDVLDSAAYRKAASLIHSGTRSVLAVPLAFLDQLLGVLYLSTSNATAVFDREHLQLLTGIAGIAASALDNARRMDLLESENRRLRAEINIEHDMVGESTCMHDVYQFISKVAASNATVLICGESGTGKELAARALHNNSARVDRPFVAINCAAIADSLLESELFGHEKGSFTGALSLKRGKLEEANGGSVFLDEIAELAPPLQAKLLRVLQEREFERVGGTRPIKVDIRLIAATNRDLQEAVRRGDFRQDLFYRLNVVSLTMPPLRERREDIPLLVNYFAAKHSKLSNREVMSISREALSYLTSYDWPGNVRELENAIERAVVLSSTDTVLPEDLPEAVLDAARDAAVAPANYHDAVREAKRQIVLRTMEQSGGNHNEAARQLGLHPNNLHRLIRTLDLKLLLKKESLSAADAHRDSSR